MKLIREEVENVEVITEGKGSAKRMYIEGTFLQGDIKNRNGQNVSYCNSCKRSW